MNNSFSESYKAAGVDITAGYDAVKLMKKHIARTLTPGAMSDIGGFGGLFVPENLPAVSIDEIKKLAGLEIKIICPSHGPIWRENPGKVLSLYNRWSTHQAEKGVVIIYASMYGNTEKMADKIARALAQEGVKNIRVKSLRSNNPTNVIKATFEGLKSLRTAEQVAKTRGISVEQVIKG